MPKGTPAAGHRVSRRADRMALRPAVIDPNQLYGVPETAAARGRSVATLFNDILGQADQGYEDRPPHAGFWVATIRANLNDAGVAPQQSGTAV